jgi:hypothetical protein
MHMAIVVQKFSKRPDGTVSHRKHTEATLVPIRRLCGSALFCCAEMKQASSLIYPVLTDWAYLLQLVCVPQSII